MKKAIVALLASFLGLFGYQIVDKAVESRVSNLESLVSSLVDVASSQQNEIESLHFIGKYYSSSQNNNYESYSSSAPSTTQAKLTTTTKLHSDGITNISDERHVIKYMANLPHSRKILVYQNGWVDCIEPGDSVGEGAIADFTVSDVESYIISTEDITKLVYDDNYNTQVTKTGEVRTYHIKVTGYTDKQFAGKNISIQCFYNNYVYHQVPTVYGSIDNDGRFVCEGDYSSSDSIYKVSVFPARITDESLTTTN